MNQKLIFFMAIILSSLCARAMDIPPLAVEERLGGFRLSDDIGEIALVLKINDKIYWPGGSIPQQPLTMLYGTDNQNFRTAKHMIAEIIRCTYYEVPHFQTSQFLIKASKNKGAYVVDLTGYGIETPSDSYLSIDTLMNVANFLDDQNLRALLHYVEQNALTVVEFFDVDLLRDRILGDCSICIESLNDHTRERVTAVPCQHLFHKECIEKCGSKCPICRQQINNVYQK